MLNDQSVYEDIVEAEWAENGVRYRTQLGNDLSAAKFSSLTADMPADLPAGTAPYQFRQNRI